MLTFSIIVTVLAAIVTIGAVIIEIRNRNLRRKQNDRT